MKKFKIDPLFLVIILFLIILGYLKETIYLLLCFFVHEIGHLIILKYLKIKINKITIYPYGGVLDINLSKNNKIKVEVIIYLSGIIMNVILLILGSILSNSLLINLNILLILINIIPIYPLDGYFIFHNIISLFLPFYKAIKISNLLSMIILLILAPFSLILGVSFIIMIIYLFLLNIRLIKTNFIFNKFILDKYLYPNYLLKLRRINKYDYRLRELLYKGYNNYIFINDSIINEKEILNDILKK